MAKGPTDFAQQNTERAVQVTNHGANWMREIAEQNLNQSKAALDGLLKITRKAVDGIDQQASLIRERSMLLTAETLFNSFDFAEKLLRMKDPHAASERIYQSASSAVRGPDQRTRAQHRAERK